MKSSEDRRSQEARIKAMYAELKLPRPPRQPGESFDLDAEEKLLRYLQSIEEETSTTYAHQLIEDGIELPNPDTLTDHSVADKLWEVIQGLAHRRTFLCRTNHLDDLELYRLLWSDILNWSSDGLEPDMTNSACMIDLLDDLSEEALYLRCRYYDDDLAREFWAEDFPDRPLPQPADPPHQRDRHLPNLFSTPSRPPG